MSKKWIAAAFFVACAAAVLGEVWRETSEENLHRMDGYDAA
jgi:hypothetical protein